MTDGAIRLPLLSKVMNLAEIPGFPAGTRFGVVASGLSAPAGSLGYIVRVLGKRSVRVVGWMRRGGYAYACDGLLDEVPDEPAVQLARWEKQESAGCVFALASDGEAQRVSEYAEDRGAFRFVCPARDVGTVYANTPCELRVFLAVAFLAFAFAMDAERVAPRDALASQDARAAQDSASLQGSPAAQDARTVFDVLREMQKLPPADMADVLIASVDRGERTSGFERYAARIMLDADPVAFRRIASKRLVGLFKRLGATKLFWLSCDVARMSHDERVCALTFESALNRLALIAERLHQQGKDALTAATEADCAAEDWALLAGIARQAPSMLASCASENEFDEVHGIDCERGGEWDIRTRFAGALETLRLPYRLTYRFSVNVQAGELVIGCLVPPAQAMPAFSPHLGTAEPTLQELTAHMRAVASATYAFRLMALLAEAAFGTNARVQRVVVRAYSAGPLLSETAPSAIALFERTSFLATCHEHIVSGAMSEQSALWDIAATVRLIGERNVVFEFDHQTGLATLKAPFDAPFYVDEERTQPLWEDTRSLSPDLSRLFLADSVSELDVFHTPDDPFAERMREVLDAVWDNPRDSAQQLSDLIGVMDVLEHVEHPHATADGEIEPSANGKDIELRPLYCSNASDRLAMTLITRNRRTRFRYVPDSAYMARVVLSRLCTAHGDPSHGVSYAQEAIRLGPTASAAYILAGAAYMNWGKLDEAIDVLKRALRFDVDPLSFGYTYYRLAFALWRAGFPRAALACYQSSLSHPHIQEAAKEEMLALMAEAGISAPLSDDEVALELKQAGIPIAPTERMLQLLSRAVVSATDEGYLNVARLYAQPLCLEQRNDVFTSAIQSLESWAPRERFNRNTQLEA